MVNTKYGTLIILILVFLSGCSEAPLEETDYQFPELKEEVTFEIAQNNAPTPAGHTSILQEDAERRRFFREAYQRSAERNRLLAELDEEETQNKIDELNKFERFIIHTPLGSFRSAEEVEERFGRRSEIKDYSHLSIIYRIKYMCKKFDGDYDDFDNLCEEYETFEDNHEDLLDTDTYNELKLRYKEEFKKAGVTDFVEYAEKYGLNDIKNFEELRDHLDKEKADNYEDYNDFRRDVRDYYTELSSYSTFDREVNSVSLY